MLTVSLIARPEHLNPHLAESLRNAWGGGDVLWLSPDEAAEFEIEQLPDNFEDTRAALLSEGVDLNALPSDGRRKKLLLADMDSTMIEQECIDELADEAGVGAHVAGITARAMNGELDFEEALTERVALLKGLPESTITRVLDDRITLAPGGRCLIATMTAHGAQTALVSGGFTAFSGEIAKRIGFHSHRANVLESVDGTLTGQVIPPILGREAKVARLDALCTEQGISAQDALAVGDGANDLGMIHAAGMGVALHAKPAVAAQSDLRVSNGDLTALLFLQGYSRDQFRA
ncbi:MAG: phosphoserine phosphatase SerB [Rhodobacterales bacterium]|nr:MAG: phosphoserine phosphatase SerB [Rhodobacterales bacterium]